MDKVEILEKQKFIFGSLFLLANKLQAIMDRDFAGYDITTKQWFLTVVIEEFFDCPPTISEVAEVMGSTHQNVKQIALKLQDKEFLYMEKDKEDGRVTRLKLTEKNNKFWGRREEQSKLFLMSLFKDLNEKELEVMCYGLNKLYERIVEMGDGQKK